MEEHADAVAAALAQAGLAGVEVIGHSMGGAIAVVLAHRHPASVSRLVLVDANLDPVTPGRGPGSGGIASFTEEEFLAGGRDEVAGWVGPSWWSTMRLAGPEALYRSAVHLARATVPTMRELLLGFDLPRTFLYPEADGEPRGADQLREAGVRLAAVKDCGHNIMLDNLDGFVSAAGLEPRP
ncbi:alpha/beta fold hydrolase [Kitasatospora sp. NPDC057940]|uniref:alpha/beta fold hydrolase n=1 Tax=Kitasatospora sp. NPDC057940 TaxID=3346285 RepID=UPI0036DD1E92